MEKELKVNGMMCSHCQKAVHDALAGINGVESVDVDLEKGLAKVTESRDIPTAEFKKVIEDAGYELA